MGKTPCNRFRHLDWIDGEGLEKIRDWASRGLTDIQIYKNMGISGTTFYTWLRRFPDLAKVIKDARVNINIEIENKMIDVACGKAESEEIETILDAKTGEVLRIKKVRRKHAPNTVMLIFLAKNRMSDKYKDYAAIPHEQSDEKSKDGVNIYIPDNGRGKDDTETAKRPARKISGDKS